MVYGRRKFVWKWTRIENRTRVRWRWVVELQPMGGRLPTWQGEILTHTTAVPFSHASPIRQFMFDMRGNLMNITNRHRAAIAVLLWTVAVECLTIIVGFVFGYPPEFGGLRVGLPVPLYWPGEFVVWRGMIDPGHQWIATSAMIASVVIGFALLGRLVFDASRNRAVQDVRPGLYGQREQAAKDRLL